MSYQDFMAEFARLEGIASAEIMLAEHHDRYSFQITSRERAQKMIASVSQKLDYRFADKKVLDIGCAYGSFAIELAHQGAKVTGIDVSEKWLMLAQLNAYKEASVAFSNCDASAHQACLQIEKYGPFDFIVLNDVFEHIYDTDGLVRNLSRWLAKDGLIYYKVPNGLHPRNVLLEGHRKIFGVSLLPPDYWQWFIEAPFHIYYRRWGMYQAILDHHGLCGHQSWDENHDQDFEQTRRHIENDLTKIRKALRAENFETPEQFAAMGKACDYYFCEVEDDLKNMDWSQLHHKYRVTFWKGIISRTPGIADKVAGLKETVQTNVGN